MNKLEIAGNTGMLPYRIQDGGGKIFTFADIAEGLQVSLSTVRSAYARNADAWDQVETGVSQIVTPSGIQEVRWFNARGAMRFPRYMRSERADALYNHLLDLFEAERAPAAPVLSEVDKVARMLGISFETQTMALAAVRENVLAVEARVEAVAEAANPERIDAQITDKLDAYKAAEDAEIEACIRLRNQLDAAIDNTADLLMAPFGDLSAGRHKEQRAKTYRGINSYLKKFNGPRNSYRKSGQFLRAFDLLQEYRNAMGLPALSIPPVLTVVR